MALLGNQTGDLARLVAIHSDHDKGTASVSRGQLLFQRERIHTWAAPACPEDDERYSATGDVVEAHLDIIEIGAAHIRSAIAEPEMGEFVQVCLSFFA